MGNLSEKKSDKIVTLFLHRSLYFGKTLLSNSS